MADVSRRMALWMVVGVVVLALLVGVGVVVARGGDSSSTRRVSSSQQVAGWRQACQRWADTYDASRSSGPGSGWCHQMADWMNTQLQNGTMGPMMMWGDPQRMTRACRHWATAGSPTSTNATSWCDQMVSWMTDHMGNWRGWDSSDWDNWMHGSMMNR